MENHSFVLFGISHIITLLIFLCITILGLHYLRIVSSKVQRRFFRYFRWLVGLNIMLWPGLMAITHQFDIGIDLPVAVCSISLILLVIYLWRPVEVLYNILFYWILVGSSLALLLPDLSETFPSLRFFSMFVTHGVNLFSMLYLVIIRKESPSEGSYNFAFWTLVIYGTCVVLPLDWVLHTNYLFAFSPPDIDFSPVNLLPKWPWYWFILLGFFYLMFWLVYRLYLRYSETLMSSTEKYA